MTEEKLNKANDIHSRRDFCEMVLVWSSDSLGVCSYRNGCISKSVICPTWLRDIIVEAAKKRFDELEKEFKEL